MGASEGAGIAALGAAIGVPLWLLTSAGGAFLGTLIDELKRHIPAEIGDFDAAESIEVEALLAFRDPPPAD